MSDPQPFVSVVIPVLNDEARLALCLQALEDQSYPADRYEVIVIDNGSHQPIAQTVAGFPHVQLLHEPIRSSYAARNRGLGAATGDIYAFTDSDCIPARDWLERGVSRVLSTPNCGLVAGRIQMFYKDPKNPTPVEVFDALTAFPQEYFVERDKYGVTANLFTTRAVMKQVGPFDDHFESAGDRDWGLRVALQGYELEYAPDVVIHHPARESVEDLIRKTHRVMNGAQMLSEKYNESTLRFLFRFFKGVTPPLRFIFSTFLRRDIGGLRLKTRVVGIGLYIKYLRARDLVRLRWQARRGARQA